MHFFPPPTPPYPSLRKIQKMWGSGTQPCNLNLQFPPADVTVSGNKLQASHHILYMAQLYWAREGFLGADCDTVISERAMPSHLTSSCMIRSQGAQVPKVISILISPWVIWAGGAQGPSRPASRRSWGNSRATVHNMLEANSKGLLELPSKPCS